jgi:glycerate 2-kinase
VSVRVLVCPDKFAGTLSAPQAAGAIAAGWRDAAPDDDVDLLPLSDGGPGFLDCVRAAVGGTLIEVPTCDPLGRPVNGGVLLAQAQGVGLRGYVESAQACGLHLLDPADRDPRRTTSFGVGTLVAAAVESGAREVVVGLGGSATNDGGAGMLAALGAAPLDAAGFAVPYGGAALLACEGLGGPPRLRDAILVAAADVDSPLVGPHGASAVYGPQKGASAADVALLDAALAHFAGVLVRELPHCPPGVVRLAGGGAAGGLGAAILACGGRRVSGTALVGELAGLGQALDALDAGDLVITGEGRLDAQSLRGKVVSWVAGQARRRGVPCMVLAGQVDLAGHEQAAHAAGITSWHAMTDHAGSAPYAWDRPAEALRALARALVS